VGTLRAVELLLVLILCCTVTGAYAVYPGQDTNWDQRNYHWHLRSKSSGNNPVCLNPPSQDRPGLLRITAPEKRVSSFSSLENC
jgi:hypothetical protein